MNGQEQQNQSIEFVGMGVQYPVPIKASSERVWKIMMDKMYNPVKYLPVTNVIIKDIVHGQHIYREMTYKEHRIRENIYFNQANYEIRAENVDDHDKRHINIYYPDAGIIEYWQENREGERTSWQVPKAVILEAMKKTKEIAEAADYI